MDKNQRETDPGRVQRLVNKINQTIKDCESLIAEVDAAQEFATSVKEKLESMREFILNHKWFTPKQKKAIDNMSSGVDKWVEAQEREDSSYGHEDL